MIDLQNLMFPRTIGRSWTTVTRQNLHLMRKNEVLADITVIVEGQTFRAHKLVLATHSPYFNALFTSQVSQVSWNDRIIIQIKAVLFLNVLTFSSQL